MPVALLWFRRDLRLADHPALVAALGSAQRVLPVFVADPVLTRRGTAGGDRLGASVAALHSATGGALVVRDGDPAQVIPDLAREVGATEVHVTGETTPYGRRRDRRVTERLAAEDRRLIATATPYAVEPGSLLTTGGTPYQVFTPFSRAWREHGAPAPVPVPDDVPWHHGPSGAPPPSAGDAEPAGEHAARSRWQRFLHEELGSYDDERDRPDLDATSRMSTHLKCGEVHPRTLLSDLETADAPREAVDRFVTELCWREFYADVLWHRPGSAWQDLRDDLRGLPYEREDDVADLMGAWRQGRTGFPIIDAGMRQLAAEGWMHNRVRMLTASFLTKDLHVWWPVGARHFLDLLRDGDLASNNHGWQWVAGTGTDAAPYFRIFNPVTQGKRFDPAGDYVRRWVPELRHLRGAAAHEPWRHAAGHRHGYPEPIVDHAAERRRALERYDETRQERA